MDFDTHLQPSLRPGHVHSPFKNKPLLIKKGLPFAALCAASWSSPPGCLGLTRHGAPEYSHVAYFMPSFVCCSAFMIALALKFNDREMSSARRLGIPSMSIRAA